MEQSLSRVQAEKLRRLIDPRFFINLPLLVRLISRYQKMVIFIGILCFGLGGYLYLFQETIYVKMTKFHYRQVDADQVAEIEKMNPFKKSSEDDKIGKEFGKLKALLLSWEFNNSFIHKILKLNETEPIYLGKRMLYSIDDIKKSCEGDNQCFTKELAEQLTKMYNVKKNVNSDDFSLIANGGHRNTVIHLSTILKEEIIKVLKSEEVNYLDLKITMVKKLISEKETILKKHDLSELIEREAQYTAKLTEYKEKQTDLNFKYNTLLNKRNEVELKIESMKASSGQNNGDQKRIAYESVNSLEEKIALYQENIIILKQENKEGQNNNLIDSLEDEVKRMRFNLRTLASSDNEAHTFQEYIKHREKNLPELTIEKSVYNKSMNRINSEIEDLGKKVDSMIKEKNQVEQRIKIIQPVEDAIVELQKRLELLEFKRNTVIPSLSFYEDYPYIEELNSHSLKKMIFFSMISFVFMNLFFLLFRFLFDDRVYHYSDYKETFPGLEEIGSVVSFDR